MIKLTDNLAIDAYEFGYIVGKPRKAVVKGRGLTKLTYHSTLTGALSAALERALHTGVENGTITTLEAFADQLRETREEFNKLIEPLHVRQDNAKDKPL